MIIEINRSTHGNESIGNNCVEQDFRVVIKSAAKLNLFLLILTS